MCVFSLSTIGEHGVPADPRRGTCTQASFSQSPTRNADPSYQRMTMNAVPTTNSLLQKSKVPLALVLTPYRSLKPGDVSAFSPSSSRPVLSTRAHR